MMECASYGLMRIRNGLAAMALAALALGGCAQGGLTELLKPNDTRFIPIALWAGADWDGRDRSQLPKVTTVTGSRENRTVAGPMPWTHPRTGKQLMVYERINRKSSGVKRQLFAVNADGTALVRVFDSRPGQADRYFTNDVIFPLGTWNRGEERTYKTVEYTASGPVERLATIKIHRLKYTYKDAPDSLKYDWILRDAGGKVLFHENYIYSPRKSMVRFRDRLKEQTGKG